MRGQRSNVLYGERSRVSRKGGELILDIKDRQRLYRGNQLILERPLATGETDVLLLLRALEIDYSRVWLDPHCVGFSKQIDKSWTLASSVKNKDKKGVTLLCVEGGQRQGLYLDGQRLATGNPLSIEEALDGLSIPFRKRQPNP
jgi:hypothetical protein